MCQLCANARKPGPFLRRAGARGGRSGFPTDAIGSTTELPPACSRPAVRLRTDVDLAAESLGLPAEAAAVAPNRLLLTAITEHRTGEGKLYLCAIKDCFSNRIVGYSIDERMTATLAVAALRNAVAMRSPAGTVVHSDRGSQFRSRRFVHALSANGLRGSMGRVGACADNAVGESFFALLQRTVLNRRHWATREELRLAIGTWIEGTYHRRRRQRRLGRLTPVEFETTNQPALAA